jgi:hypothetical protein
VNDPGPHQIICATCRWPLDSRTEALHEQGRADPLGVLTTWVHSDLALTTPGYVDHEPVPVRRSDLGDASAVTACDFDSAPGGVWVYPAESFLTGLVDVSGDHRGSAGSWAACETCHADIEAERWGAIHDRALARQGIHPWDPSYRFIRSEMARFHAQFRRARTGPAYRQEH